MPLQMTMMTENYTIIATALDNDDHDDAKNIALVVTSGHNHAAHAVSPSTSIIIDCGVSSHFSPDKNKFLNVHKIDTKPVKAANRHIFKAIGCGDLKVKMPTCNGYKPMTITLQGAYFSLNMAFTLISISCLDHAGCSIHIEDGACILCDARPQHLFLSSVP